MNLSEGEATDGGLPPLRVASARHQPDRTFPVRAFSRNVSTTAV